ncbi:MAG: xanthine dehydrogenase family protein molybdopterin-binding subunit [Rhodobacteraceae bacterium]|nr:xanthine dehydrogenase family protein molybdopterin-binding subunit [Paracoccaceae bacterium]
MGKILRRTFLIGTAAIAGGVAFGFYKYKTPYDNPLEKEIADGEATFNSYIKITSDNKITIIAPRAEMGQGVSTTLAALVAEELDVEIAKINVEHGPASFAYHNRAMMEEGGPMPHFERGMVANVTRDSMGVLAKFLGLQVTGGSSSIKDGYVKMRQAGCAARETLKLAAAAKRGVDVASLKTADGHVIDGETKIPYGDLALAAAKIAPPAEIELRSKSDWKILGKSQSRTDMVAKVTGAPIFGMDVDLPDMLYGTVRMNPHLGGKMISFDASKAEKMPGVVKIIDMSGPENEAFGGGIGVIASNTWAAFKAAEAVEIEWGKADYPTTSGGVFDVLEKAVSSGEGSSLRDDGNVETAFADASRESLVEAEYRVPYLAHSCMEPMNATAWLKGGKLQVWTGTQAPTIVRGDCAYEAGIEEQDVQIHTTYLGGGFGRRGEVDFPRYATRLAKHSDNKPVKVVWSREEDMTHDTYRPAAIGRFKARLGDKGMPVAIDARIAAPSTVASVLGRTFPSISPAGADKTITEGSFDQPYAIADYRVTGIPAEISIPVGFWRSVGNSFNGFFHESFIDEIAAKAGIDPLELRRKLMKDHPTALGVVNKVAEMASWGSPLPEGHGKGIAFTLSFGSWVAQVVEVSSSDDGIKIENVRCAADVGEALDPAIIKAQLESAIIYGLSSAMGQEITFADGMVEQTNFDSYDAMRIGQCPKIHTAILENAEHMGGVGEIGTPPSIPALANAIFAATGKRIRTMPLSKEVEFVG